MRTPQYKFPSDITEVSVVKSHYFISNIGFEVLTLVVDERDLLCVCCFCFVFCLFRCLFVFSFSWKKKAPGRM